MSAVGPLTRIDTRDLLALKLRIDPQVTLIEALVKRTPSLNSSAFNDWNAFAAKWSEFFRTANAVSDPSAHYEHGLGLEQWFRNLKSVLSSQCLGVPSPAPKREAPLVTWITPNIVREQKNRISPRVRDITARVEHGAPLGEFVRNAWASFATAWFSFESGEEEWLHCFAQYDTALAYEDALSEWVETFSLLGLGSARTTPSPSTERRSRGVAPGLPVPGATPPSRGQDKASPPSAAPMAIVAGLGIVGLALLAKGSHR